MQWWRCVLPPWIEWRWCKNFKGVSTVQPVLPQHGNGHAPNHHPPHPSLPTSTGQNGHQRSLWQVGNWKFILFQFLTFYPPSAQSDVSSFELFAFSSVNVDPFKVRWENVSTFSRFISISRPCPPWRPCWTGVSQIWSQNHSESRLLQIQ